MSSPIEQIRERQARDKAHYVGDQYPQYIRDIDYLLDLVSIGAQKVGNPVEGLALVGSAALRKMKAGRRVIDATGDVWFKLEDGRWSFRNVTTSSDSHLVQVFGPIRALPAEGEAE